MAEPFKVTEEKMGKKLKVGIFGIRRGGSFANIFNSIPDTEVVAVCDNSEIRVKNFLQHGMNIVVLCNYCTKHTPAAIKALKSGKHVLSEVIACKTLSEGVSLCRKVEKAEKKGYFICLLKIIATSPISRKWRGFTKQEKLAIKIW